MADPDIFLYQGESNPFDVRLRTVPAAVTIAGTGASTAAPGTSAAQGIEDFIGTSANTAAAATSAAQGKEVFTATGSSTATPATSAGQGKETESGTGAGTGRSATSAASGNETFTGTSANIAAPGTSQGSENEIYFGTGAGTASAATSSGTGTITTVVPEVPVVPIIPPAIGGGGITIHGQSRIRGEVDVPDYIETKPRPKPRTKRGTASRISRSGIGESVASPATSQGYGQIKSPVPKLERDSLAYPKIAALKQITIRGYGESMAMPGRSSGQGSIDLELVDEEDLLLELLLD